MCKKHSPRRIDRCLEMLIHYINEFCVGFETVACCCGHEKYPMTILLRNKESGSIMDMVSGIMIRRKRNFYRRDADGYYYLPETIRVKDLWPKN